MDHEFGVRGCIIIRSSRVVGSGSGWDDSRRVHGKGLRCKAESRSGHGETLGEVIGVVYECTAVGLGDDGSSRITREKVFGSGERYEDVSGALES